MRSVVPDRSMLWCSPALFLGAIVSVMAALSQESVPELKAAPVDFVRDIRPILASHCFPCHGPDAGSRKAGLSLATFEDATKTLRSGARPLVPGKPEESEVWRRINDRENPMPPVEAHDALDALEVAKLGAWIREGASYAPHWAYVAPKITAVPEVAASRWPTSEIDRYIQRRLLDEGLEPAPDADAVTLVRRVTFDLLGLPAEPSSIDAYAKDTDPRAFERLVDGLLDNPHFGERMAVFWLDLVRFADTCGYHGDQDHNVWPYRDYVINAFNANKPFDQFTVEQLAGDLLPDPTQEQLVATAYNRLLQTSHEGGVQLKEYRAIYMADRVRNVSETWMGATVGCAQCHDHKYDPYTARDFHALGAFFADVDDEEHLRNPYDGLNTLPTRRLPQMRVRSAALLAQIAAIDARIAATQSRRDGMVADLPSHQSTWELALHRDIQSAVAKETLWVDDALLVSGKTSGKFDFVRQRGIAPHRGQKYRVQTSTSLVQHYVAEVTKDPHEVLEDDIFFAWVHLDGKRPPKALMLQLNVKGNWNHRAVWGGDEIEYGRRSASWAGYRRMGDLPDAGRWVRLEVRAEDVGLKNGDVVSGMAFAQFGGSVLWDDAGILTGRVASAPVVEALDVPFAKRTRAQHQLLREHQERTTPELVAVDSKLAALKKEREQAEAEAPLVMYTTALPVPREVRVLPRGNWLDETGEIVEPAIPAFLGATPSEGRATRLDLARWLVTEMARGGVGELTARVFVNRVWALFFGEGLCPSTEDFGGQGVPPTHLALLDRLTLDFVASGFDVKALVKRLLNSRTYRQSSVSSEEAIRRDPANLLFARQTRRRLPAEGVRDALLAISGLLVRDLGGPSVKPPQPAGYYQHLNFPPRRYRADTDARQWRRGVYVHWQRQYLHPMLKAFDAPTREECTARRPSSNTPLAALTLMNDPVFVEASLAFAAGLLHEETSSDVVRIQRGFRQTVGRHPEEAEIAALTTLLAQSRRRYGADPQAAATFVALASNRRPVDTTDAEFAAWAQIARALLNLHEAITRE